MKNLRMRMHRLFAVGAGLLTSGVLLTSCLKNRDSYDGGTNDVSAGIMAFNLAPGQSAVGFRIGGNALTSMPLGYNNFTATYLAIYPGSRTVDAVGLSSGNTLASATGSFETGNYYSVFLVGTDSTLQNVIVRDNFDSLNASGKTYVRYINAIADPTAPTVTISSGATNTINETAPYKNVSGFVAVDPGSVTVTVSNGGSINATRALTLDAGKAYTILLIGKPGATGDAAVQVRYITNGTLNNSQSRIGSSAANSAGN